MFTNVPEERYALIIGSVQSGKSTLLNTIAEHCGVELNTPVGTGDKSCTTGCAVYNFKTPSKSCAYKNVEESFVAHITDALTGGTTEPEPSGFSLSDFLDDEDFVAKIQEYPSMEFKIGLIDTPGLRGLDEEIIHDIVSTIRRVGYLSSIILVFGKGTALSGALIEVINYYASLLSGFRCSILVVHTKWDPLADDYVTATKTRQENIDEILGAKGFHLIHYFVDLLIPPTSSRVRGRYREHCIALRCNRLNSIISNVYSSPLIDAQKLTIPKPRSMVLNDEAVRDSLELAGDAVRSTLQKLDSNLQDLVPQIEEAERCIAKYTTQLDTVNNRLNVVDTNQLVEVASVEVEESWGFFVERKKTVEVFSNTDVYDYKAVCDTPYTKWKRIKVEPRRVKGTAISPWFRGAYGRLIALSQMKAKHHDEIVEKVALRKSLEVLIRLHKENAVRYASAAEALQDEIKKFTRDIEIISRLTEMISQERVDPDVYCRTSALYRDHPTVKDRIAAYCAWYNFPQLFFTQQHPEIFEIKH